MAEDVNDNRLSLSKDNEDMIMKMRRMEEEAGEKEMKIWKMKT